MEVKVGHLVKRVDRVLKYPKIGTVLIHIEGASTYKPISILSFSDQMRILSLLQKQQGVTSKSGAKLIKLEV